MPHPPQIPLTPQTDERLFPRWQQDAPPNKSGSKYPKMLTRPCTREDREKWAVSNKRRDQNTGQDYFESTAPRLGAPIPLIVTNEMVTDGLAQLAGEPVIVNDQEEEVRVRAFLGLDAAPPKPSTIQIPIAPVAAARKQVRKRRKRRTREEMARDALLQD